jgi:hypothetical protein
MATARLLTPEELAGWIPRSRSSLRHLARSSRCCDAARDDGGREEISSVVVPVGIPGPPGAERRAE